MGDDLGDGHGDGAGGDGDFAAAAMLRLIRLGLARQGLPVPPLPRPAGPHLAFDAKRALAQGLLAAHGPAVLLRIGEGWRDAPDDPLIVALRLAADPPDLVRRWQRLERYVHSRHHVEVLDAGPGRLVLAHRSRRPGAPPQPAESLLVGGLLGSLAAAVAGPGLRLRAGGERGWRDAGTDWAARPLPDDVARWTWAWRPAPARQPTPVAEEGDLLAQARALLDADPGADWSLARLAAALGASPRSLQRRLARAGSGFVALREASRLARSARLLATGSEPAAQVGYLCGYADQAHFTRAFRRHTALTPARYRAAFATAR